MTTKRPTPPRFLIIGAQKSGTRFLRYNLGLHPDIHTPEEELSFFNNGVKYQQGLEAYLDQYVDWDGEPIVGEATPGYMMWRHRPRLVADRIAALLPDVRLMAVLRHPIDRTYSAFIHHMRRGRISPRTDILNYVRYPTPKSQALNLVEGSWYASSLRPFFDRFDRPLVLLNEDLASDPVGSYEAALRHIDVSAGFVPDELFERRFENSAPRQSHLSQSGGGYAPLDAETRSELAPYFRREIQALQELIDRDLSHWLEHDAPSPVADIASATRPRAADPEDSGSDGEPLEATDGTPDSPDDPAQSSSDGRFIDEMLDLPTRAVMRAAAVSTFGKPTYDAHHLSLLPADLLNLWELSRSLDAERILLLDDHLGGASLAIADMCIARGRGTVESWVPRTLDTPQLTGRDRLDVRQVDPQHLETALGARDEPVDLAVLFAFRQRDEARRRLDLLAPQVRPGGYLLVTNTIRESLYPSETEDKWSSAAVAGFLAENDEWVTDRNVEIHMFGLAPGGYLARRPTS